MLYEMNYKLVDIKLRQGLNPYSNGICSVRFEFNALSVAEQ